MVCRPSPNESLVSKETVKDIVGMRVLELVQHGDLGNGFKFMVILIV